MTDYHVARPEVVAIEAVTRAAVLSEWTGARIHVYISPLLENCIL